MRTTALRGFRLSFQQERLWRWSQENQLYHGSQCAIKLEGPFDPALFHRSLQQVVDQYEILRTTFYTAPGMEQPVQVLGGDSAITCPLVDVSHLDKQQQNEVREEYWHNLQLSLSDLEQGPLLQSVVLRLSAQCHVLLLHVHALIADACTLKLLVLKLLQAYEAYHVGKPLLRDEDELQYIDISSWQYELLQDQDVEQQQTFWRKLDLAQLANIVLPLQPDSKNSWRDDEMPVLPPQQVGVLLDAEQQALLMKLCQYYQVSPEAFLLACWQMLLWRLTGENPLIGLAGDGRPDKELEAVFGPGLWTVPFALSTSFSDQLTGEWLIKQTQQVLQEVIEKQLY